MTVGAVGLVDKPANERPFLVLKADEGGGAETAAPAAAVAGEKAAMVLSPETKQVVLDALGTALEELSGIASMIADISAEEGAPVPPELRKLIEPILDKLEAALETFSPAAAEPEESPKSAKPEQEDQAGLSAMVKAAVMAGLEEFAKAQQQKSTDGVAKSAEFAELRTKLQAIEARTIAFGIARHAGVSNAAKVDGPGQPTEKSGAVTWPSDLAADATRSAKGAKTAPVLPGDLPAS